MNFGEVERIEVIAVKVETVGAIKCVFDDQTEHWIPKYAIDDDSEVFSQKNDKGTLIVSRRFAEKEGLI